MPYKANPIYFYHSPKFKTEDKTEVSINLFKSVKLAGFTSPTKLLYIINSNRPILLAPEFMKYKLI